jgi:hypothetical protein
MSKDQKNTTFYFSHRWRAIIEKDPRRGVFEGIRAIIHTSESRAEAFRRLLELGKGSVVTTAVPPFRFETFCASNKRFEKINLG